MFLKDLIAQIVGRYYGIVIIRPYLPASPIITFNLTRGSHKTLIRQVLLVRNLKYGYTGFRTIMGPIPSPHTEN